MKPVLPFFGVIAMGAYLLYYHANSGGGTGKFLAGTAPATGFVFHYAMVALLLASVLISLRKINGIPELAEALHQTHWWFYIFFFVFLASAELDHIVFRPMYRQSSLP